MTKLLLVLTSLLSIFSTIVQAGSYVSGEMKNFKIETHYGRAPLLIETSQVSSSQSLVDNYENIKVAGITDTLEYPLTVNNYTYKYTAYGDSYFSINAPFEPLLTVEGNSSNSLVVLVVADYAAKFQVQANSYFTISTDFISFVNAGSIQDIANVTGSLTLQLDNIDKTLWSTQSLNKSANLSLSFYSSIEQTVSLFSYVSAFTYSESPNAGITTVPEPDMLLITLAGLVLIVLVMRTRNIFNIQQILSRAHSNHLVLTQKQIE